MKILHVVHGYHPSRGGSQWLVQQLAERQVQTYGHQVSVFTTVADDLEYIWRSDRAALPAGTEHINGVTVRRFPVYNGFRWPRVAAASLFYRLRLPFNDWARTLQTGPIIRQMTQAVAASDADIIVATGFPLLHMYYAGWGARRAKKPLVLIGALHTDDSWGYERKCIFQAIEQADAYIALTPFENSYLIERGVPQSKISVIGAGVDLAPYEQASGARVRKKYGWGTEPVVCAIGKFVSRKRYEFLLEAMKSVWQETPEARLVLAGGYTDYLAALKREIAKLPTELQGKTTLLTDISEAEKRDLLDACSAFVLPSIHESFGIVFIEAWAAKKPVIGADAGAIASTIQQNVNGLLFEASSEESLSTAITELLTDSIKAEKMGQNGWQTVSANHTWNQILDKTNSLYQKI